MHWQDRIVYLNGDFQRAGDARISVLDRGFIFGDGVYEVIPVYGGRLFRLEEHLRRLGDSLRGVRMVPPLTVAQWRDTLTTLVERNGGGDLSVYLQITRGVAPRDHAFPPNVAPTVFAMASPLTTVPKHLLASGVEAITMEDFRWRQCNIKAIALLPNILARQQALDAGAAEAILIRDGWVTEGAASNIFSVKDSHISTPSKGPDLLPGITRDLVLELAAQHGMPHTERRISAADLRDADEIWLTSSTKEVLAVTSLDGKPVGAGRPGPVWEVMYRHYQAYKSTLRQ